MPDVAYFRLKMPLKGSKSAPNSDFLWKLILDWPLMALGSQKTILKEILKGSFNFEKMFTFLATLKQLKQHYKVRYGQCYPKNASQWAPNSDFSWKLILEWPLTALGNQKTILKEISSGSFNFEKIFTVLATLKQLKQQYKSRFGKF